MLLLCAIEAIFEESLAETCLDCRKIWLLRLQLHCEPKRKRKINW